MLIKHIILDIDMQNQLVRTKILVERKNKILIKKHHHHNLLLHMSECGVVTCSIHDIYALPSCSNASVTSGWGNNREVKNVI